MINEHITASARALNRLDQIERGDKTLQRIANDIALSLSADKRILLCGNGGSAADAQHIAAEFIGRFRDKHPQRIPMPAIALTCDSSVLTAVANDYSFARIFSRQVDAIGRPNDLLWCLSTSGESPNVVEAAVAGRALGMRVIAFTGEKPSKLGAAAHQVFRAPSNDTAIVQQLHAVAYHAIIGDVEERLAHLWRDRITGDDHA